MFAFRKKSARLPRGKPGERAYAIGDIHGCLQETLQLLEQIEADCAQRDPKTTHLIFLGDLIDRGPESRGVIELLMDFPYRFAQPHFITGNHEEMMVRGLMGEPELLSGWLEHGGFACAESYGVPRSHLQGQQPDALEHILRSAIPKKHADFLKSFLESVQFGDYFFTHAGIRPGIPLDKQSGREMRWIRGPFLEHEGDHGVVVVHGHTVNDEVVVKSNRIGLDTGAYKTGKLSAICIEEESVSFLSTT
ncbi:MAG: serine/threonine protein phosphatase [Hyphomonadaceae bacterium]|nr:serine/threonine protein phosphatase [Hyphomonadaceae bacterium]